MYEELRALDRGTQIDLRRVVRHLLKTRGSEDYRRLKSLLINRNSPRFLVDKATIISTSSRTIYDVDTLLQPWDWDLPEELP